ncbi:MAG: TlyA family RNA methyltransferase [Deltaproteobacteria bacterium]|nr:MAG: TlyA family RNA methyltransferase [Deltaproteobacteria bacterium]
MPAKERLDLLLVQRGLAPSRTRAAALAMAGCVLVDDRPVSKPGTKVPVDAQIRLRGRDHDYVSRGGVKLAGALDAFRADGLDPRGRIVLDVGASTGGFTDCLLRRGVERVHALDVGYGQLHPRLARDPRVVVHDRTNIRTAPADLLGELVDLVVVDCSFVSLAKVLPSTMPFLRIPGDVVALVKPQFELEPGRVGKGGIVRDDADREAAVRRVEAVAQSLGLVVRGRVDAPIAGRTGNREIFVWLHRLA